MAQDKSYSIIQEVEGRMGNRLLETMKCDPCGTPALMGDGMRGSFLHKHVLLEKRGITCLQVGFRLAAL